MKLCSTGGRMSGSIDALSLDMPTARAASPMSPPFLRQGETFRRWRTAEGGAQCKGRCVIARRHAPVVCRGAVGKVSHQLVEDALDGVHLALRHQLRAARWRHGFVATGLGNCPPTAVAAGPRAPRCRRRASTLARIPIATPTCLMEDSISRAACFRFSYLKFHGQRRA